MPAGPFTSCTIDYTGRKVSIAFGAPTPNAWNAPLSEDGDPPTVTVNGLKVPIITLSSDIVESSVLITGALQGVVNKGDIVTLDGSAGWLTDAGAIDETGVMSSEAITNNSEARRAAVEE